MDVIDPVAMIFITCRLSRRQTQDAQYPEADLQPRRYGSSADQVQLLFPRQCPYGDGSSAAPLQLHNVLPAWSDGVRSSNVKIFELWTAAERAFLSVLHSFIGLAINYHRRATLFEKGWLFSDALQLLFKAIINKCARIPAETSARSCAPKTADRAAASLGTCPRFCSSKASFACFNKTCLQTSLTTKLRQIIIAP